MKKTSTKVLVSFVTPEVDKSNFYKDLERVIEYGK
jgi:hypothetical protein